MNTTQPIDMNFVQSRIDQITADIAIAKDELARSRYNRAFRQRELDMLYRNLSKMETIQCAELAKQAETTQTA